MKTVLQTEKMKLFVNFDQIAEDKEVHFLFIFLSCFFFLGWRRPFVDS